VIDMRICHVTPHLPPDQAANALLPFHLGRWAREAGDSCAYVAHEPRQASIDRARSIDFAGKVTWIASPGRRAGFAKPVASLLAAWRIARAARPAIDAADVVHVHSNGLLPEVGAWLAARHDKPSVLTLYGTEIWHYKPRRWPDLFTRAYRSASAVTFYSHGLMDRAKELGLQRPGMRVVYPPVAVEFRAVDEAERVSVRAGLGFADRDVLVNVKRLHPLAGQEYLVRAMPEIQRRRPGAHLVICGTGALASELQSLAVSLGVAAQVTFTGLIDNATVARYDMAADLFVLPSLLEACPTVALEALACGTRVVSSDNPGGVELNCLFGTDVTVVPRENPAALAEAIVSVLAERRRVSARTAAAIERDLRLPAVASEFRSIYQQVQR
jgi:glycosyltransferase involved in cell wall biosynthesis